MTNYVFEVYGDADDWTEEEKQLCIKRHETWEKQLRQGFEDRMWQTHGNPIFIKTGKENGQT